MEPTVRNWPSAKFDAVGYAPSATTILETRGVILAELKFSNTDTSDRQVVLLDGNDNVMFRNTISAGDLYVRSFPQGWKFDKGVKINAAAANVVRYELLGFKA